MFNFFHVGVPPRSCLRATDLPSLSYTDITIHEPSQIKPSYYTSIISTRCSLQPTPVNGVLCYGPLQTPIAPIYPPPKFSMGDPEKESKDNGSCSTLNHQTDGQRGVDERVSPQGTCCSCSGNTHQPFIGWIEHNVPSTGLYVPIHGSPLFSPYQNLEQMASNDQKKDQNTNCSTDLCDNDEKSTVVSNSNIERNDEQSSTIKNNHSALGKNVPCLELDRSEDSSEELESLSETTPQITRIQYTSISDNTCTSEGNTSKSNKCLPKTGIVMHSNIQNTNKNANKGGSNSFLQNKSNMQMSSRTQPKVLPQNERGSFTEKNKLKKGIVKKFEDAKTRGIHTVSCRSKMEANQPEEIYLRDKRQRAYRSAEDINWDCKRIHNDANENEQRGINQTMFQYQKSDCEKSSGFLYESAVKTKAQDREEYGKSVVDSSDRDFEQIASKVFSTNEKVITEEIMSREDVQNKPFTVENSSLLYANSEDGDDNDEQPLLTSCNLKEKGKLTAIAKTKLTNGEINTKVPLNPKDSWETPVVSLLDKYQTNQTTVKQFDGEPIEYNAQEFVGKLVAKDVSENYNIQAGARQTSYAQRDVT
uniref:Uncharacterized protein n=1 Tax=Timema bartmani TaxID=61472 RepID=A0A7R9F312_9NEOP|nr:unnamed protein product [Timema bartmani]